MDIGNVVYILESFNDNDGYFFHIHLGNFWKIILVLVWIELEDSVSHSDLTTSGVVQNDVIKFNSRNASNFSYTLILTLASLYIRANKLICNFFIYAKVIEILEFPILKSNSTICQVLLLLDIWQCDVCCYLLFISLGYTLYFSIIK